MRLCLGTVQFGLHYGIQGAHMPSKDTVFSILDYAMQHGITELDTASGYGEAHKLIGEYLAGEGRNFHIITKLPKDIFRDKKETEYKDHAERSVETSLQHLNIPKLNGLLFHNPLFLYDEAAVKVLMDLKTSGYTEQIGVSVYCQRDAEYARKLQLDLIQLPVNLFDRRFNSFIKGGTTGKKIKVYARSVYLQGLLLMDPEEVKKKLPAAYGYIKQFDELCSHFQYSRREIALSYIKNKSGIASLVFGVDSLAQLKEDLEAYNCTVPKKVITEISGHFERIEEDIISPQNWIPHGLLKAL